MWKFRMNCEENRNKKRCLLILFWIILSLKFMMHTTELIKNQKYLLNVLFPETSLEVKHVDGFIVRLDVELTFNSSVFLS